MKKLLIIAFCAATAVCSNAQLLWKISGKGQADSYLMASHHLAPLSILDSIPSAKKVVQAVIQVCGEVDATNSRELLRLTQQAMMLPTGKSLDLLVSNKAIVDSVMQKYLGFGIDNPMAQRLKPAAVSTLLAAAISAKAMPGYNSNDQIDLYFQTKAQKAGKPVIGLETVQQQVELLFGKSLERQAQELVCTCRNIDWNISLSEMLGDAYVHQDLRTLEQIMNQRIGDECDPTEQEFFQHCCWYS